MRVSLSSHPQQHLVFVFGLNIFLIIILVRVEWHLNVIPLCFFLITNDVGHFFHMLIGQLYIYFEEMSIQGLLLIFELGCLFFCCQVLRVLYNF